jgi:hypothetical protein
MPQIEDYQFGQVTVDGQRYTNDLIVYPDHVQANWWRREGHRLAPEDLGEVLEQPPEVLVVGQGSLGMLAVPEATRARLQEAGIEIIAAQTGQACETYNEVCQEKRAVLALHLTC